jgi:dTMP kinase
MAAKYICIEGSEGVGKSTQTKKIVQYLRDKGYKVLETKEPGSSHLPLTMKLREIMLDGQYSNDITPLARELISQAIRSIHIDQLILPALDEYDFIIQDRGILSGLAYVSALEHDFEDLEDYCNIVTHAIRQRLNLSNLYNMYNKVIYLRTKNSENRLNIAKSSKQEFQHGDAIENKGEEFIKEVNAYLNEYASFFDTIEIEIDNKNIDQVFSEIILRLEI